MARKLSMFLSLLAVIGCSDDTTTQTKRGARLYATVSGTAEVLVIDEASHALLDTIPVGKGPAIIASTPDHKKLYTANWADNTVSVIDTASDTAKSIAMAGRPYVIAMSHDGKSLYVGQSMVNAVAIVDTATDTVTRSIKTSELPASVIVSADDKTIFVAFLGLGISAGKLIGYDVATGTTPWPAVEVGSSPAWITIGKDGEKVYTLNFISDDVSVVDTHEWEVTSTVATGTGSQGIIGNVTPDGKQLWVTNHGTNDVIAIDTGSNEIVKRIALAAKPVGVSFNLDGTRVYITDFGPGSADEDLSVGLSYLTSGVYSGSNPGQVRAFDTASGAEVGKPVATGPGTTSVVFVPADE
jgi:YVTN family beta-propeller protein